MSRPTKLTKKIADEICRLMADEGKSLLQICKLEDMPHRSTVHRWLLDSRNVWFRDKYALAESIRWEREADKCLEIADDGSNDTYFDDDGNERTDYDVINRSKLRVDTRKWFLSRMLPKRFSDTPEVDSNKQAQPTVVVIRNAGPDDQ